MAERRSEDREEEVDESGGYGLPDQISQKPVLQNHF